MNDERMSRAAACIPFVVGVAVLVGWAGGWPILVTALPGQVTMKANTALCFAASGAALYLHHQSSSSGSRRLKAAGRASAFAAILLGLLTLGEYATGQQWGIDELLVHEPHLLYGTSHPGRMAPNSALNFVLLGTSVLLLRSHRERAHRLLQGLTLFALLITLLAFLGYVFQAHILVGLFSLTRMAIHTLLSFVALSVGILLASSKYAWLAEVFSAGPGGRVGRRLLPAALILPVTSGLLMLMGYRANLYDAAFGAALMVSIETVIFTFLIWACVQSLNATERVRAMSHVDELTQLMNRRGFFEGAERLLDGSDHREKGSLLVFVDLDGMKGINDQLGHHRGDDALVEAASALRKAFRGSDVVARLGGDEFAALAPGAAAHVDAVMSRIDEAVREINDRPNRLYRLELSVGSTVVESGAREKLSVLLARADAAMYTAKATRRVERTSERQFIVAAERDIAHDDRSAGEGRTRYEELEGDVAAGRRS